MKHLRLALAAAVLLAAPAVGQAQWRGGHGGHGGGGFRDSSDAAGPASADAPSRWSGSPRGAAPAVGGGHASRYGRGGYGYRGRGYRGYPGYGYWGGVDLGFALGYSLAYPWYFDDPWWGYGPFYGPAAYYGPGYFGPPGPDPEPAYDSPFDRDYGPPPSDAPPTAATQGDRATAACGAWVWNETQSRYDWNTNGCPSGPTASAP